MTSKDPRVDFAGFGKGVGDFLEDLNRNGIQEVRTREINTYELKSHSRK